MRFEASRTPDSNLSGKELTSDDVDLSISDPGMDLSEKLNVGT